MSHSLRGSGQRSDSTASTLLFEDDDDVIDMRGGICSIRLYQTFQLGQRDASWLKVLAHMLVSSNCQRDIT